MFAAFLTRRKATRAAAERLYGAVVTQARRPAFYARMGVADTLDGRFDMIALHAVLVARRLERAGPEGARLGQALFTVLFDDMDRSLREMGVGDLGVGRRVKTMAKALFGRARAYGDALDGRGELDAALARNLYRSTPPPPAALEAMAGYVRAAAEALAAQPDEALLAGDAAFVDPPPGD